MYIRETFINETKGHQFGDTDWYEASADDIGGLFKSLRSEYGACTSKMYRDRANAPPVQVGWVFRKRMEYDDYRESRGGERFYVREVWVEVSMTESKHIHRIENVTSPWSKGRANAA